MTWLQRTILIVAALFLLMFAFNGATNNSGNAPVAAFNFIAAVVLLYLAARRSS